MLRSEAVAVNPRCPGFLRSALLAFFSVLNGLSRMPRKDQGNGLVRQRFLRVAAGILLRPVKSR